MPAFYESDRAVAEYLLFHYGAEAEGMPWSCGPRDALGFPARCVSECLVAAHLPPRPRALDLGCAVGRASFELARQATEVVGIDSSARFIAAARRLQAEGELSFPLSLEGGLTAPAVARVPSGIDRARVRFEVGDALDLRPDLGRFDVVLAANLLDRVPRPAELLARLADLVPSGGQLILTSPYTWLEEYTPPRNWLCADGRRTSDVLGEHLGGFERIGRRDLPFVIREHERKFQWSVAEATIWLRR